MRALFAVTVVAALLACGPQEMPPESNVRATASHGTLSVELVSAQPLHVGQNAVSYRVLRDGVPAANARVIAFPLMQMSAGQHTCPTAEGLIIFTMPTAADARWTLAVEVDGERLELGEVEVADSPLRQFVTRDEQKVVLTAGLSAAPSLGANTLVVTAHRATDATMMSWEPVNDFAFTVTPEMPAMGHGSSNNHAPVLDADGLYRGTVNFSMAGEWIVHLGMTTGDSAFGTFDFPFSL